MKRLFQGLRTPPRSDYDAVVVGAGVGGLVCANLLARGGLRVLLIEQHYMVGGYCSTFRRDGFTFDASTHFYPLLGNPQTEPGRLLRDIGAGTEWIRMDPVDRFHFPDGTRFDVPVELEEYLARVRAEFPREREALARYFSAVREANLAGLLGYFRGQRSPSLDRWESWTVRDALDHFFSDAKLKLLLTADCPHWGSPPARTSFVFDAMLRLAYFLGNYYPRGSSQAFADDLARCLEEQGGEILMSTAATRITTHGGAVTGLEMETTRGKLRGSRSVRCGHLVANFGAQQALSLISGDALDGGLVRDAEPGARLSFPCFLTHLGVQGVPRDEIEAIQGYYWKGWNPDEVGRGALACKIFSPTLYDPDLAPPGGQILILQKVIDMSDPVHENASDLKSRIEAYMVAFLETVLPGVSLAIVSRSSASDQTAERFTMNSSGAMLGWEMAPDQLGEKRPDMTTPFRNLHFVGHWTRPGGGIAPVMVSATRVAEAVLSGVRCVLSDRNGADES